MPFERKPDIRNKKYLIKKVWTSFDVNKTLKVLEIDSYLKEQESCISKRKSNLIEGTLELKKDF